jgi:hypothetical protein
MTNSVSLVIIVIWNEEVKILLPHSQAVKSVEKVRHLAKSHTSENPIVLL